MTTQKVTRVSVGSPQRRTVDPTADYAVLELFGRPEPLRRLRPELAALIDLRDPDIEYIADSIAHMKTAGLDVDDGDIFRMAIDAGHRRADAAQNDLGLMSQRDSERVRERREAGHRWRAQREARSVVYYMRLGNRVKIGYTIDIATRCSSIQPEELLATERGGKGLEEQRHGQFDKLRVVGEWFRYEGALVAHVAALQHDVGQPAVRRPE